MTDERGAAAQQLPAKQRSPIWPARFPTRTRGTSRSHTSSAPCFPWPVDIEGELRQRIKAYSE